MIVSVDYMIDLVISFFFSFLSRRCFWTFTLGDVVHDRFVHGSYTSSDSSCHAEGFVIFSELRNSFKGGER